MLIEGVKLRKVFEQGFFKKRRLVAVDNVDIRIDEGETLALVGESGSGKSTLGRMLLLLLKPTSGKVFFEGVELTKLKERDLRKLRRKMQLIPQHPEDALDPRWKLYDSIAEPLKIHGITDEKEEIVYKLAEIVGLGEEHLMRYPHEVSGGELQRAVIARAISLNPKFIVCDEPTSMLDVSVQASIVNLLLYLQRKFGLSYLFITHDLELANAVADRIAVMYRGQIVEEGVGILDNPIHPYTKVLLNGDKISDGVSLRGCVFYHLCPERSEKCLEPPEMIRVNGRTVRCHLAKS